MTTPIDKNTNDSLSILENSWDHIFLTGNAGTGKSTLLDHFRNTTKKKIAIVAPTGVAAVNVKGETIHSFFKLPPSVTPTTAIQEAKNRKNTKIYQSLQTLVIDEISMVRADLMDSIDSFLRNIRKVNLPFGGVQLIMVGDLYQLPPVVTREEEAAIASAYDSPYFFSSKAIGDINQGLFGKLRLLELNKIYRQSDKIFIDILNRIRKKEFTEGDLTRLNDQIISDGDIIDDYVILTAINAQADAINQKKLDEIAGPYYSYRAEISGEFNPSQSPAQETVILKTGARVMLSNNDPDGRWINGTVGRVFSVKEKSAMIKLDNSDLVEVFPHTWTAHKTVYNPEKDTLESLEMGSYKQMPLRLAWAITIHKSQGKTFDKVAIDLGRGAFAHGQTYVALSRCTSISGLKLLRPINSNHIIMDERVTKFFDQFAS